MAHAYQRPGSAMLLAAATLLSLVAIAAAGTCHVNIPKVPGIDQSPTNPSDWGKCTNLEGSFGKYSHWCKFGKLGSYPTPPTQKAQECLKFGRASIYRGPIYGSSAGHLGACNRILRGNDKFAMVAVSTKYLKTYQGGWTSNRGACHQCMCIRLQGGDDAYNKGLQKDSVDAHRGLTFLGKVGDRCSECPDDQIDILMDRPFSYAPWNPSRAKDNPHAAYVNAKDGLRGFANPEDMRNTKYSPEAVGTWTADWQFVPCDQYDHNKCADLMKSMGYATIKTPQMTRGVDSATLRDVAAARVNVQVPFENERPHCAGTEDKEDPGDGC